MLSANMNRYIRTLIMCMGLVTLAAGTNTDECSGCEQVDYDCEFGPTGCVKQAEQCGAQCCQSSLSWLLGCRGCRSDCDVDHQACAGQCRAALDNCHSGCELVCCEATRDCFAMTAPFFTQTWPTPQCHDPLFRLYRSDIDGWQPVTLSSVPALYNAAQDTVFLVHGYRSSPDADWVQTAKDAFLTKGDYNIIAVDWTGGTDVGFYPQAASNVRVTGADIAGVVAVLNPTYVWCVGHSLGAHSCGHAGKRVHLHRITGLDPAGPMFELDTCSAQAELCRLYHTDADQVDVIHTDAKGTTDSYGTILPLGNIDFYPNGIGRQPSCPATGLDLGCSHGKATEYFVESILSDCFVTQKECTNEQNIPTSCIDCEAGDCPNMGASTAFGRGIYYLTTNAEYPFCKA